MVMLPSTQWIIFKKIELVQYNTAFAITGVIKGSSRDKLYQELGLEYLQQRRWIRQLCFLCKFLSTGQPSYIHKLPPKMRNSHRYPNIFPFISLQNWILQKLFFFNIEWVEYKLSPNIRSSSNYYILCNAFLKFIRPAERKIFNINDPFGKNINKTEIKF